MNQRTLIYIIVIIAFLLFCLVAGILGFAIGMLSNSGVSANAEMDGRISARTSCIGVLCINSANIDQEQRMEQEQKQQQEKNSGSNLVFIIIIGIAIAVGVFGLLMT